jgi:hypothetical protein
MHFRYRVYVLVVWGIAGFAFPLAIMYLCNTYGRSNPASPDELAGLESTGRSPAELARIADWIALGHVAAGLAVAGVVFRPGLRLWFLFLSLVQLVFTVNVWFVSRMALSGYWL